MNKQVNHFLKHYDIGSYKDAYRALQKTTENDNVNFYLSEITLYGGIVMININGTKYQATKKKIRTKDFAALIKGSY